MDKGDLRTWRENNCDSIVVTGEGNTVSPSANTSVTLRARPRQVLQPNSPARVSTETRGRDVILLSELIIVKELFRIRNNRLNELSDLGTLGLHRGGLPPEVYMGGGRGEEQQDHTHEGPGAAEVTETSNLHVEDCSAHVEPGTSDRQPSESECTKYGGLPVLGLVAWQFSGWSPAGECP